MEIELRNVGIIRSAHLVFNPGLNLIVGSSSSGKSTLLRAIRSLIDNSFSDSSISYGQKKLAIRMKYNDHSVTYIRDLDNSSRKSAYQIDGKLYTKIGRTSLDDLSNLFKLVPIDIDGEKINFNFSAQFSGPFLLLGSSSLLYSILTYRSSFDITKINDLYATDMKQIKKDIDALVKTKNTLDKEKEKKESELERLRTVPEIYTKVHILKSRKEEYNRMLSLYKSYKDSILLKSRLQKRVVFLTDILNKLNDYSAVYDKYSSLYSYIKSTSDRIDSINRVERLFNTLINIEYVVSLFSSISVLRDYVIKKNRLKKNRDLLGKIKIPNPSTLSVLNNYMITKKSRSDVEMNIKELNNSLSKVLSSIKEVGVCPLCQQPICNC